MSKLILDPCCGSKMFWFNKNNEHVLFGDIRQEEHILCDGRVLKINPDKIIDFREIDSPNKSFKMVVFDPPHLLNVGEKSWMFKKYGRLNKGTWQHDLYLGFQECFRVLDDYGALTFKWAEKDISVNEILKLADYYPVVGQKTGKTMGTHWLSFMKADEFIKPLNERCTVINDQGVLIPEKEINKN